MQVGLVSFQLWQHFRSEWKEVSASIFHISIIIITIIIIIFTIILLYNRWHLCMKALVTTAMASFSGGWVSTLQPFYHRE